VLGVQQPVLDFFPQRTVANLDANKNAITIKDLLTMRAGFECTLEATEATLIEMMASPDWVQFALDLPMADAPGTRWVYCSPATHLLTAVIQRATGMSALDFAREQLFDPLGISDVIWSADPQGIIRGYGDMRLTPHDTAKLGYLYLNQGQWDGRQLLPASWVAAATRPLQENGYGYLWWLSPDFYSARGRGGQWIIVAPDKNMVLVLTNAGAVEEFLASFVFPAARSTAPLPPNPDGVALLESRIQQAAKSPRVAPWPPPSLPTMAQEVSGKTYTLDANPIGFLTCSLTFKKQAEAVVRITAAAGSAPGDEAFEWLVGLDNVERVAPGRFGIPAAAKGSWESEDVFVARVNEIGNNFVWRLSLTFKDDQMTLAMEDLTGFFPHPLEFDGKLQE
jgi:hypothetical protein